MNEQLKKYIEGENWSFYGVIKYDELKDKLKEHEKHFEQWEKEGNAGSMEYLKNMQKDRFHPENKLPDINSIIVLGAWYSDEQKMCSIEEGDAQVARYAVGKDYHKVLKKKLIHLSDWLKEQNPLADTYISVDSGPTVDRVLAEAAGLGFFGKNSMIINPSKGSYFFIASVMTNLDLEATEKKRMPNCGDCRRCFDACPTGAIKAPGKIDANLCISYLTIENKEGIPEELREKVGNRIFGCDICQEVCPFNIGRANKQEVLIENLKGKYGAGEALDLKEILSMETDEQFTERFAGTPLMRAKRRGMIRNACVVAGNSGNKELIPYLEKVIEREEDGMLRGHAKWALGKLK